MNGIDPVIIATGNDWRAIEAGAHAYAARDGRSSPLRLCGVACELGARGGREQKSPVLLHYGCKSHLPCHSL